MNKADRGTVFHAAEGSRKGGRKKKYVSVSVFGLGSLEKLSDGKRAIEPKRLSDFPPAIKLSKLNELLGISRASVYRMVKQGLKTYRPTGPNGDQHVRREALEAFMQDRQQFMATHRR